MSNSDTMIKNQWPSLTAEVKQMCAQLPVGICFVDSQERIHWANQRFYEQLGISQDKNGSLLFNDLPIQATEELGNDVIKPLHDTKKRLHLSTAILDEENKVAVFTDVSDLISEVSGYADLLLEVARMDASTGLLAPASIYRELFAQVSRCRRYGNDLAIARIGIDELSTEGIDPEDREKALRDIGVKLADNVRTIDFAGRLSDNEFLVVLPETDLGGAKILIDKLRPILGTPQITTRGGRKVNCQICVGFSQWMATDDASKLLEKASPKSPP